MRSATYDTIILQTYDVGEADRFCILFTRERGRLAAKAKGVRRPTSRMGGSVLPLHRGNITLDESRAGLIVTGVKDTRALVSLDLGAFLTAQQGIELLLVLLQDDEPLREIFDATLVFLTRCHEASALLPYTIRLLTLLGLLSPDDPEGSFGLLDDATRGYVVNCMGARWAEMTSNAPTNTKRLSSACELMVRDQSHRQLKATGVVARMG